MLARAHCRRQRAWGMQCDIVNARPSSILGKSQAMTRAWGASCAVGARPWPKLAPRGADPLVSPAQVCVGPRCRVAMRRRHSGALLLPPGAAWRQRARLMAC